MVEQSPGPFLGWRIWVLRQGALQSPVIPCPWHPGQNTARCLARKPETERCPVTPGMGCGCGFWAVWSPFRLPHPRTADPHEIVLGLIQGFGTVALHGKEGFRAEMAIVACIFTDRLEPIHCVGGATQWRAVGRSDSLKWILGCRNPLKSVADGYGLPHLSIQSALAIGLLGELGMLPHSVRDVEAWLSLCSTRSPGPKPPSGPLRLRPA